MIYAHLELSETSVKARDLLNDLNRTLFDRKHSTFYDEELKALPPMFSLVPEEKDDLLLAEVQS
ncbi:hypothetical protein D3C76_1779710 [compost metagenome]